MSNISIKKDFQNGDPLFAEQLNLNFETIEQGVNGGNKMIWQDSDGIVQTSFRGTTEEVNNRPVIDGQTLYNTETGETFLDVGSERISTGAGNILAVSDEEPTNPGTKVWIKPNELQKVDSTEVIDSLEGNETNLAPSVRAVKNALSYSTEEQVIGTWTDGKSIYRKVVTGVVGDRQTEIYNNSSLILINFFGYIDLGTGVDYHAVGGYINENNYSGILKGSNGVNLWTPASYKGNKYEVILEYTKTTD